MALRAAPAFLGEQRTLQSLLQPHGWRGRGLDQVYFYIELIVLWMFPVTLLLEDAPFGTFKLCFSLWFPINVTTSSHHAEKVMWAHRKNNKKKRKHVTKCFYTSQQTTKTKKSRPWHCQRRSALRLLHVHRFYHHQKVVERLQATSFLKLHASMTLHPKP